MRRMSANVFWDMRENMKHGENISNLQFSVRWSLVNVLSKWALNLFELHKKIMFWGHSFIFLLLICWENLLQLTLTHFVEFDINCEFELIITHETCYYHDLGIEIICNACRIQKWKYLKINLYRHQPHLLMLGHKKLFFSNFVSAM